MTVGCLGDIVFKVSSETVRTLSNFQWAGNVNYSTHKRHAGNSLVEFTGIQPDTINFDIYLSHALGVDIIQECNRIWDYARTAKTLPFVLGDKAYGKYRWVNKAHKIKYETYDPNGNPLSAKVTLSLMEYTKE